MINSEQRTKKGSICISDNGIGFYYESMDLKGLFGLLLVKKICMQLDAKLVVESNKNKGTSYHVYFKD